MIAELEPDAIISTYPGVTTVLGMLREKRRLDIPVQSAITDLAGLRYWAHPGVDVHYVTHPESIEEVERLVGPGRVEWARPPISADFLAPRTRRDAREALGVDAHARMVLVSGGGWGVGDLERAIELALADGETEVVCISGRNELAQKRLEARFSGNERVRVLGFTDQMSDWMAAADAMIHATAGLTVLEAHIRGCPVISYGFSAGHLRANNAAFERFGIAEVARSDHELESTLRHVAGERRSPDSSFASLPSIASRSLVGAAAGAPGAGLAPAHGTRRRGRRAGDHRGGAGDLRGAPREPAEAAAAGHQPHPHRRRPRPADGDPGGEEARPGRQLPPGRERNRRSRSQSLRRAA